MDTRLKSKKKTDSRFDELTIRRKFVSFTNDQDDDDDGGIESERFDSSHSGCETVGEGIFIFQSVSFTNDDGHEGNLQRSVKR